MSQTAIAPAPINTSKASRLAGDRERAIAGIALLAKAFPRCFVVGKRERRPLKVGISNDIIAKLGAQPKVLGMALRYYANSGTYLKKIIAGTQRYGLDGKPSGIVTDDEERVARAKLFSRKKRRQDQQDAVQQQQQGQS